MGTFDHAKGDAARRSAHLEQQMYSHLPNKGAARNRHSKHQGQTRVSHKSVCVDANELRRKLNVVLAQQNAEELRRKSSTVAKQNVSRPVRQSSQDGLAKQVDSATSKSTSKQPGHESRSRQEQKTQSSQAENKPARTVRPSASTPALDTAKQRKSNTDLKRLSSSAALGRSSTSNLSKSYQHTPHNAASQFVDTATAESLTGKKQKIHPLAQQALEKQERARVAQRQSLNFDSVLNNYKAQQRHSTLPEKSHFPDVDPRRRTLHVSQFDDLSEADMDNMFEDEEFVARRTKSNIAPLDFETILNRRPDWSQPEESQKRRFSLFFNKKTEAPVPSEAVAASLQPKIKNRQSMMLSKIDIPSATKPSTNHSTSFLKSPRSPLSFFNKFKRSHAPRVEA